MKQNHFSKCARRSGVFLWTIGLATGLAVLAMGRIETAYSQIVANPMRAIPIPAQVLAKDGVAQIPDSRLWYWDTGGQGVPIVLLHPSTGSALIWGYQQPVFAKAGYRGSSPIPGVAITTPHPSTRTILALAPRIFAI